MTKNYNYSNYRVHADSRDTVIGYLRQSLDLDTVKAYVLADYLMLTIEYPHSNYTEQNIIRAARRAFGLNSRTHYIFGAR